MNREQMNIALTFLILLFVLGYAFVYSMGTASQIRKEVQRIVPESQREEIDTAILNKPALKEIEALRTYGQVIIPSSGSIVRPNPFEGL